MGNRAIRGALDAWDTKEAAVAWGAPVRTVRGWFERGYVRKATRSYGFWHCPIGTPKPKVPRAGRPKGWRPKAKRAGRTA